MKDKNKEESLKYLGAIGGLLAAYGADAQITYVDVADTTLNTNNAEWRLNIDEDTLGVIDYRFIQYVDTSVFNVSGNFIQALGSAGNSVLGLDYGNYAYPFNLSPGDSIGSGKPFKGAGGSNAVGQLALELNGAGQPNDNFTGAVNGLIGLRFRADVNDTLRTFYGWLRVDVAADFKSITIKDYAYNTQYGEGITAGEGSTWIGIEDQEVDRFALRQMGEQLFFENPSSEVELKIFSTSGQMIHQAKFEKGPHRFDLNQLAKGIYIARLSNAQYAEEIRIISF